ncbi:MAG: methionine aminotransferase [Bacteroidetes bacterium]|nr:MAG: methionine aminotransferase [Bacteroidota bacterium]
MPDFSVRLRSKLPGVKTTIFTQMSSLANEVGAINLSQGFPNFDVAPELIELVHKAMIDGHNQYAPMQGVMELREVLSDSFYKKYNTRYNADTEITITSGATQAIYSAISTVINEGDEAIIIEPAFDIYAPSVIINGGVPRFYQLKDPDYHIEWSELRRLITANTKLIIINTPHNPTSTILNAEDLKNLEQLTNDTDIIVLSDEVYEHIIFDGKTHESVARYPNLAERSFVVGSFGKTFHVTGWKTGFCMAPAKLMAEFRKIHQNVVFAGNRPMQTAIAEYMQNEENYINLSKLYQEKRDYFLELMKDSRFEPLPSFGTYFQLFSYDKISDESENDYVLHLTKEHRVAAIPLSYFYRNGHDRKVLRFCFAKTNETLEQAAELLCKI